MVSGVPEATFEDVGGWDAWSLAGQRASVESLGR